MKLKFLAWLTKRKWKKIQAVDIETGMEMSSFEPRMYVAELGLLVSDSSPFRGDQQNKLSEWLFQPYF